MHDDIPRRPAWWCDKLFGRKVWSEQQAVVEAPFRHQFSLFPTGHGIGKTDAASMIPPLWMLSHYPTYVLVLSASWPNITGRLFPAMKTKLRGLRIPEVKDLIGKRLPQISRSFARWKLDEEWETIGLSPDEPEVVQGWHSEAGTLVLVDEASDLSYRIFDPLLSLIKSEMDAMVFFGNPVRADGPMADIMRKKPGFENWYVHPISTLQSPNYVATQRAIDRGSITVDEDGCSIVPESGKEVIAVNGLQTWTWVKRMIKMHGEGSAFVESRVYGRLPQQSEDTFIPRNLVMDCATRPIPDKPGHRVMLIVDPAWSEQGDRIVFLIYDPTHDAILHAEAHLGMRKSVADRRIRELCETYPVFKIRVDEVGYGRGIVTDLQDNNYPAEGINFSRNPHDPSLYTGCRDESYALAKKGLETLAIPENLVSRFEELSQIKFSDATGRLKIEDKKKFKSRGNRSPDYADALVMIYTRLPGDAAFPHAGSTLKSLLEPVVWKETGFKIVEKGTWLGESQWMIRFKDISPTIVRPRSGYLLRSMWYSRRETSGAVWIHVDNEGCWTIFDSYKGNFLGLAEFARQVHMRSFSDRVPHNYAFDAISAPAGAERQGSVHMISTLHEELMNQGDDTSPLPQFLAAARIGGMAGFDVIDRMILSSLSRFPEDDYWEVTGKEPKDYTKDEMLVVWPQNVVEELTHARLRQPTSWRQDTEEDKPQEAVGGGGPLVRALRLLAVAGAGVQVGGG